MGQTHRKTTIIVGAGASKEFGLPTGVELKKTIGGKLNILWNDGRFTSGDLDIVEIFKYIERYKPEFSITTGEFQHQCWHIRDNMALAPSIDNFLHTHQNNKPLVFAGKIAISKSIAEAEKECILYREIDKFGLTALYGDNVATTWLGRFFTILIAEKNFKGFLKALRNLTFISFNYDRCIHEFFCRAAKTYFMLDDENITEILEALNVIYPYGTIGDYSWSNGKSNFGQILRGQNLVDSTSNIQTFTEGLDNNQGDNIYNAISNADNIIFMGFGFLTLNMDYLFQQETYNQKVILATAKGLSKSSIDHKKEKFIDLFFNSIRRNPVQIDKNLKILDMTCADLMHEFNAYLSG